MKQIIALIFLVSFNYVLNASANTQHIEYPVHIIPGSPSKDYQSYLRRTFILEENAAGTYVQKAIAAGTRNLKWLDFLNANRPDPIALTRPGELHSYPIETPSIYSPATIERDYKAFIVAMPDSMRAIIFGNAVFAKNLSVTVEEYILWAKKVDDLYQTAARWASSAPYLHWYAKNKVNDIRGYYFLSRIPDLEKKLSAWSQLSNEERTKLTAYLVNICENSSLPTAACQSQLSSAITNNITSKYYAQYSGKSKTVYDSFFKLGGVRKELQWNSQNSNLAVIPFRGTDANIENFLMVNIEEEWRWLGWQLKLDFKPNADVHIEFQAGVVPHVNGIAGNTIVMDKNALLTEWDVQWTIRHEFGHVLGFTDCYVEFYDTAAQQMVNYQIDITNLMCSRAGKIKQTHFNEMKSNYYK